MTTFSPPACGERSLSSLDDVGKDVVGNETAMVPTTSEAAGLLEEYLAAAAAAEDAVDVEDGDLIASVNEEEPRWTPIDRIGDVKIICGDGSSGWNCSPCFLLRFS